MADGEAGPSKHPWILGAIMPLLRVLFWILFLVLGPFKVVGRKRVPKTGGLIILSNHLSDMDPIAVQYGCPRLIYFMSKSELFEMRKLAPVIRFFRAFPVKRGEPDRGAIKKAVAYAQGGGAVCIFPEGELSESGDLLPLKPGIALIVRMAGVPVVACRLDNTNRVLPYGRLFPKMSFCRVKVRWSEPRQFDRHADPDSILAWAEQQLRP